MHERRLGVFPQRKTDMDAGIMGLLAMQPITSAQGAKARLPSMPSRESEKAGPFVPESYEIWLRAYVRPDQVNCTKPVIAPDCSKGGAA